MPVGVSAGESVNLSSPVCIIIGSRLNQTIEFVDNLTASHYHNTDAAHTRASAIGFSKSIATKSCIVFSFQIGYRLLAFPLEDSLWRLAAYPRLPGIVPLPENQQ